MNRLETLQRRSLPLLTCYLPAGDPLALSDQAQIYADQGVDIYEIGVPYSDPFVDGELIADSMKRTLTAGITQTDIALQAEVMRKRFPDQAVVMMGYPNMLPDCLCVKNNPVADGVLQVGGISADLQNILTLKGVYRVEFIGWGMSEDSLALACNADGYIMLQAAEGKTGLRDSFDMRNRQRVQQLREQGISVPVLLGIGISTATQVKEAMDCGADGVVIGSACMAKALEGAASLGNFLREVRRALDEA